MMGPREKAYGVGHATGVRFREYTTPEFRREYVGARLRDLVWPERRWAMRDDFAASEFDLDDDDVREAWREGFDDGLLTPGPG
jgi:hypothetical protein